MTKVFWLLRLQGWGQRNPALAALAIILLLYGWYLPATPYQKQYYDADAYWVFAGEYFKTGHFSFISPFNYQRGYLLSSLLAPLTLLVANPGWTPLAGTRLLVGAVAAALFGWAVSLLWQAVKGGAPVSLGHRLLFAGPGFVLWRGYFNFSLTDFPAQLAVAGALVATLRGRGMPSGLAAGVALGAALNLRPVYRAALPAVALLALLPLPGRPRWWGVGRGAALAAGVVLVLLPQAYTNQYHAGVASPWVLTNRAGQANLFLQQLGWGLAMQKCEANVAGDCPRAQMIFEDQRGKALLASSGRTRFTATSRYLALCLQEPWRAAGVFARHLFNGLDGHCLTPYIREVIAPTWPLAWLNYSLVWAGWLVLLGRRWPRLALVLLALLLPGLAALPTAMECRFLLPLHLLLSAAFAFGMPRNPYRRWRTVSWRGRGVLVARYMAAVGGFSASNSAQKHLAMMPRHIVDDLPLHFLRPPAAPEPW